MKRIAALVTAMVFLLTLGAAFADEGAGTPWQQKETRPLIASKTSAGKKEKKSKRERKREKKKRKREKRVKQKSSNK